VASHGAIVPMTSPAVWGPSADSSRLEVELYRRLGCQS